MKMLRYLAGALMAAALGCSESAVVQPVVDAQLVDVLDATMDVVQALDVTAPTVDVIAPPVDATPWRCVRRTRGARPAPTVCNGDARLCGRTLDAVSFPTTHNAMSTRAERFNPPNHERAMRRQLDDGVRAMMLDVYPYLGEAMLCHGVCTLGRRRLAEGLCDIAQFTDEHPDEVLVLILENYAAPALIEEAVRAVEMEGELHVQRAGEPWPTLGAMLAAGHRVVMLTDSGGGQPARPWLHALWAHAFETHYAADRPTAFSCAMNRGEATNPLFIFNHFLTAPVASPQLADMVNHNPSFLARARECATVRGHLPNFVTVDFYETGDLFSVVRSLNGLD